MDHFTHIYQEKAAAYHRLIAAEDAEGNLTACLERHLSTNTRRVLDLGTGTGRLPLLLAQDVVWIVGLDRQYAMLRENVKQRDKAGFRWGLIQGDMRTLPFPDRSFDLITAGWALGHFTGWYPENWPEEINIVLQEMLRVTAPGGQLIIIETLSTGNIRPAPPTPALGAYYKSLEKRYGFEGEEIATDYVFPNPRAAADLTEFFFGQELAETIIENNWSRLPEFTGVWTRKK